MKCLLFILFELLTTFQPVRLQLTDCTYESNTSHVEYICHSDTRAREQYSRKTYDYLYCNNHHTEIYRATVRIVTFRGCDYSKFQNVFRLYQFEDLRVFNVSTGEIESLSDTMFQSNNHLEKFIASHNNIKGIPTNLFVHTPELMEIDLSHNKIEQFAPEVFNSTRKMKIIQIAHNQITTLPRQLFVNLVDLEVLDVSHNKLTSLESSLFISNKKLRSLNLENNPLLHLRCALLKTLNSHLLKISFTSLFGLETTCAYENEPIKYNVIISSNETMSSTLTITNGQFDWIFTKTDFMKLQNVNFENSHMRHIPSLLEEASTELISLDLSNTFVGELNEKTFENLTNLEYLYLCQTNLTNFEFATFHHQTKLKVLDLSYNGLNFVDFRLFVRNFQNLESLNLEGNSLTEIDSVIHAYFPKLSTLAISENRFTCQYLANFLHQWQDSFLINISTSNRMQMNGVDCFHGNNTTDNTIYTESSELYVIKMLLIILISIVCLSIFFAHDKCKRVRKLFKIQKNDGFANKSILFTNQEHGDTDHAFDNCVYDELSIEVN